MTSRNNIALDRLRSVIQIACIFGTYGVCMLEWKIFADSQLHTYRCARNEQRFHVVHKLDLN